MYWNKKQVEKIIARAIEEDIGTGDITTDNLIKKEQESKAVILAKEEGIIAGLKVVEMVFNYINPQIIFKAEIEDGKKIKEQDIVANIKGSTQDILKAERIVLNFLQRLSGIATKTNYYVNLVKNYPTRIVDTRKTTPTLRILEKYAVTVGQGHNHRMGLYDAVMIKDNHIIAAGSIKKAIKTIREVIPHTIKIEVEVEDLAGVKQALEAKADIIMLDNMSLDMMSQAVEYIAGQAIVEASGGIDEKAVQAVAKTGVDIISIGALTHQINSLDLSLNLL